MSRWLRFERTPTYLRVLVGRHYVTWVYKV